MMNQKFGKKESCFNFWLFLFFSVITWIYLWLFVDPALLFQRQQPAFYFDYLFLQRFTVYPGGLMQYFSAFLAQLYLIPAVGAAVIVLVLSGIAYFTHRFFRSTGGYTGTSVIAFLPSIILLVMHTDYNFSLNGSLGLLAALSIFTAFTASFSSRKYLINILFLLLFPFLYYCFGAPVLYCALLAGLYVMTTKTTVFWRRLVFTLACYILACCVPFLSIANYTIASVFERLTSNLVLPEHTDPDWLPYLLYGFYPAGLIIMRLFTIRTGSKPAPGGEKLKRAPQKKRKGLSEITKFSLNLTVLFLATAIPAFIFYNPTAKFNLKIEYLARGKNWQKVLQTVKGYPHLNFYTAAQVNRALYHSGRLLETMFYWPQEWGSNGLLIPQEYGYAFPMQISDLFFDMGGITEAQHWAYEAQAVYIDSPWNIQRLFLTHVLKRNNIAALRYLTYISKSPLFKNWAKRHEIFLDDPANLVKDPDLRQKFNWMPMRDFIIHGAYPQDDLESMLQNNKFNKMAFEYYMAYCLLSRQIDRIVVYADHLLRFNYAHIPQHLEEAFCIYLAQNKSPLAIQGYGIREETMKRFNSFWDIVNRYRGDPNRMQQMMNKDFKDTYWYYFYFFKERDKNEIGLPALHRRGVKK